MFAYIIALLQNVKADRKGVTALEYGILAALIAVAIIAAATTLGTQLALTFTTIAGHFGATPN